MLLGEGKIPLPKETKIIRERRGRGYSINIAYT
jgi:hypothetical protein